MFPDLWPFFKMIESPTHVQLEMSRWISLSAHILCSSFRYLLFCFVIAVILFLYLSLLSYSISYFQAEKVMIFFSFLPSSHNLELEKRLKRLKKKKIIFKTPGHLFITYLPGTLLGWAYNGASSLMRFSTINKWINDEIRKSHTMLRK